MNEVRKYLAIAELSARSNLAYISEVGSRLFFLAVVLYIFMKLWQATYANADASKLGGLTLNEMIWYLAVTESIIMSSPRVSQAVDEDVRTGTVAVQLVRPLSYPLYRLAHSLGERTVRFFVTLLAASLIALVLVGPLPSAPLGYLFLLCAIPLAFMLDFFGYFLVGLAAFWMEDTSGLNLLYSRMTMILGGMLVPLELFPEFWQGPLRLLPFSNIVYGPARAFVHPELTTLLVVLGNQIIWVSIFGAAVWLVYSKALNRIAAHGG